MDRLAASSVVALVFLVACGGAAEGGKPGPSSSTTGAGSGGAAGAGGATGTGGAPSAGGAGGAPGDAGAGDGGEPDAWVGTDCSAYGVPGKCLDVSACAALPGYSSTPDLCPGPASIECCAMTPSPADNPPIPVGYKLMMQSEVTPAMTTWAVSILDDAAAYPMFSTVMKTFGALMVLARVEWHPPDFQNAVVHRGVTLYEPG